MEKKHLPAVSLNAKYDVNKTIIVSTDNKNTVEIKHEKKRILKILLINLFQLIKLNTKGKYLELAQTLIID